MLWKNCGKQWDSTVDEHLWKMGRLGLNSGRLPKFGDEVAVEADVLSALGYDYELGQKIDLTVSVPAQYLDEQKQEEDAFPSIQVTKTYTLCGVLKEYTNLWEAGRKATLNSAILTEKGAQELLLEAKTKQEEMVPLPPEKNCFFIMKNHDTSKICEINEGLKQEDAEIQQEVLINTYAYPDVQQMEKKQLFHWAIFIVSLVAIVCLYMLQVRRQVYQIALFRSIGITKKQFTNFDFFRDSSAWLSGSSIGEHYRGIRDMVFGKSLTETEKCSLCFRYTGCFACVIFYFVDYRSCRYEDSGITNGIKTASYRKI